MFDRMSIRRTGLIVGTTLLLASVSRAQFVVDNSNIPSTGSYTENVDFGDIDLDGDWDVAVADGGDIGNDQNRIWVNDGFLQAGTLGEYTDETATRCPNFQDDSRDIEFVDFDNDDDLDIYVSNTAQLTNQGNRWWVNDGNAQAGTLGFYTDETAARWVNLGGAGSSIAVSQLIAGSFIDWSCDCDFGDLDNDGDMDLVHSTYGGTFGGSVPTRIFLNDGDGNFEEFNPSGFQLTGPSISTSDPGLWCDGTQQSNTTNSSGTFCDIATTALDIDVGDIDGDFDLDILHGARNEPPRMFANRLDASSLAPANGGNLGFRDVTGAVYPSGYTQGTFGHYEQEMGDMDGDGDLDLYGLNWLFSGFAFTDITLRNNGSGVFGNQFSLPGSDADDNEGDFIDYDNDGDLDLYVANFSGQDKLYRNDGGTSSLTLVSLPSFSSVSLDADAADTDGDGDYDVLVAEDQGASETFLRNTTGVPDTTPPYLPNVEDIGNQTAAVGVVPVRAQVYDNAPYYITWYNPTQVNVTVDGKSIGSFPARSSGGQIFRAELPANLIGSVSYAFSSSDAYSNVGNSANVNYTGSTGLTNFADAYGTGFPGTGGTPSLTTLSVPFSGSTMYLAGSSSAPGSLAIMLLWDTKFDAGIQVGSIILLHAFGENFLGVQGLTDASGCMVVPAPIPSIVPAGFKAYGQFAVVNGGANLFASSPGLEITVQ